jgi:hypothetical protein
MQTTIHGDNLRVVALAVATWGGVVAAAFFEGAFTRFDATSVAIFAAMVSLYAVATCFLDREVRAFARSIPARIAFPAASALVIAWVAAFSMRSVPVAVFLAPLALASAVAAIEAAAYRSGAATSAAAKSPDARRAAT